MTFVATLPTVFAAWSIGQAIFSGKDIQAHLGDPGVLRTVIGTSLYLTVIGLLGLGLGAVLRNTAAGISTLFGVLFVLPIIVHFLPSSWGTSIDKYLPSTVGQAITEVHAQPGALAPWPAFALFCGYAALVIAVAAVLLRRRDA